jgi:pimeloyl-ACP methyl ester carboxylesterase
MKKVRVLGIVLILIGLCYLLGPRLPHKKLSSELPVLNVNISNVEDYVKQKEASVKLRPDNEARILWANDSTKERTEYVVLYLHGFSASWYEGYPVNEYIAKQLHANAYFSRLASHGIDTTEALIDMTPYDLYESAKEALLIASALGNKVVLVSTSTGGTLSLKLAADFPDKVNSLILLSPNVEINNSAASLLSGPWGLQIAHIAGGGGKYRHILPLGSETEQKYWYKTYRWEATVYLQQLLDETMKKSVFKKVKQPLFLAYYYKNEKEQDPIVRVSALLKMYEEVSTPENLKYKVALPDAGNHVIGCETTSHSVPQLENEVSRFIQTKIINK